ncbi:glycoside hydrolase family 15 protein [Rhodopila sp.]|jgi:GH15 family glucan-1,4-alpha-glucosidase|uniref:glycoside hydrolase family 15 protein n=1 Tax=Rhodopila sp. TaxID=2480087 RepID=UPI002BCD070D|nr:glycoside hydrolase family 15 protein [Rhodopila sp.]HVZ06440.1 glycoside hydrolase family 15 protein [Rhodopila sp.]
MAVKRRRAASSGEMPAAIEDYALIGNCRTAALVSRGGSIDWLCLPRFDSPAVFAALLGTPDNGRWLIRPVDPNAKVTRHYWPGTLILETVYETATGEVAIIDFMAVEQQALIRIVEGRRGSVPMRLDLVIRFVYGSAEPWVTRFNQGIRAVAGPDQLVLYSEVRLRNRAMTTRAEFTAEADRRTRFILSHAESHEEVPRPPHADAALDEADAVWSGWSNRCDYQGPYHEAVVRSLLTLKALTYNPTGGIVAAPTTSLPEEFGGERNWDYRFCWLRDATFTLLALMQAGYREEAQAWGAWLHRSVAGSPSQVQTLYGLRGERWIQEWEVPWLPGYHGARPVRIGNGASTQLQIDVYGELIDALYQEAALGLARPSASWDLQYALVRHLEGIWDEPDRSIWEVRGDPRHFTFSKVMAWVAFDRAIRGAERFGMQAPVARWRAIRQRIHDKVCREGFSEAKNSFTQFFGGEALDASLLLIPQVGFLPPDDPRVIGTVEAIGRELMADGLIRRYLVEEKVEGLRGEEGTFLACSFWYVDALALIGRGNEARMIFERLLGLCNDVGLLAEEYDPVARRQLGNFPQALSHLALINSAFNLSRHPSPAETRAAAAAPEETDLLEPG